MNKAQYTAMEKRLNSAEMMIQVLSNQIDTLHDQISLLSDDRLGHCRNHQFDITSTRFVIQLLLKHLHVSRDEFADLIEREIDASEDKAKAEMKKYLGPHLWHSHQHLSVDIEDRKKSDSLSKDRHGDCQDNRGQH